MQVEHSPQRLSIKFKGEESSVGLWLLYVFFAVPWTVLALMSVVSAVLVTRRAFDSNPWEFVGAVLGFPLVLAICAGVNSVVIFALLGQEAVTIRTTELTLVVLRHGAALAAHLSYWRSHEAVR